MATTNEVMVELCQKLTETNQEQGKQIAKLISQIETLTKILEYNGTRAPPKEADKKLKTAANKRCKMSGQFHKNPNYF